MPAVSVIMPTFNTDKSMIVDSIESILNQSYNDFELIIIDDGSVNYQDSLFIKSTFHDQRIKVIKNDLNSGVAYSLNRGLQIAKGKYIVRMDSDDIAKKQRIEELVKIMEINKKIVVAGSNAKTFGASHIIMRYPEADLDIRSEMIFNNPFCHPTVIFRKDFFEKHDIFYPENVSNEDYALWVKLSGYKDAQFYNIQKCLLKYRTHENQVTKKNSSVLNKDAVMYHEIVFKSIGLTELSTNEVELFMRAVNGSNCFSDEEAFVFAMICKSIIKNINKKNPEQKKSIQRTVARHYKKFYLKQKLIYKNQKLKKDSDLGNIKSQFIIDFAFLIA